MSEQRTCRVCGETFGERGFYASDWRGGKRICKTCHNAANHARRAALAAIPGAGAPVDPAPVVLIAVVRSDTRYTCACGRGYDSLAMWRQHVYSPDGHAACRAAYQDRGRR